MNRLLTSILLLFMAISPAFAENNSSIARIDLSLAVSLHPRMSLFDFDRMGFYKVTGGLNEKEFSQAIAELRNSPAITQAMNLKNQLEKEITAMEKDRAILTSRLHGANQQQGEILSKEIQQVADKQENLRLQISDINYQIECPDLTTPAETRKLLDEVEQEILAAVASVARQQKYSVVLNSAVPYSTDYPARYKSGPMYGQGIPGINTHIFYSFLASSKTDAQAHEAPPSRNIINWLELTSFPEAVNLLPIRPWPIVLHGGQSILSDVIKLVYENHKISPELIQTVNSVIHKIEKDEKGH